MPSRIRTSTAVRAQRSKEYRDIDLNFAPHPLTGDISTLTSVEACKAAIRNIILTKYGEKPFFYKFGSRVNTMLFENFNSLILTGMREEIKEAINAHDPRIFLFGDGVRITPEENENRLHITITFGMANVPDTRVEFSFFLNRVR